MINFSLTNKVQDQIHIKSIQHQLNFNCPFYVSTKFTFWLLIILTTAYILIQIKKGRKQAFNVLRKVEG